MQDPGYELPRIPLPRTPVNKGIEREPGVKPGSLMKVVVGLGPMNVVVAEYKIILRPPKVVADDPVAVAVIASCVVHTCKRRTRGSGTLI
jgi:hypothetical protein